ncbi:radical SAM/SPASM domain-containing protein [Polymorphum gilvum]|uniref:Fe-s oxidoreductase protein n=1 Tax=Polymorphum gilvum (strain LMG 25793 / CGMCC 1.9160 / SL003B-26A1) TaxID=991905 RepID=F2IY34_POLGS|nr:radical SAM protein [Polymorphum gilvum]ADZ70537.1 Fe-s oxidoreductase protein [Polymorphum gilvum SL003B-26A1]
MDETVRLARLYDGDPAKLLRTWAGDSPPRIVVWELTLACDLGCRHCGSRAGKARRDELDTQEALDVVRQLADLGVAEVILIGGEVYLRDDWFLIAAAVTQAGMTCSLVTGGRGFDAGVVDEALAAGVRIVGVSIDGLPATHDRLRGVPGSYEAAIATARRIAATGRLTLSVNTQINRLSLPELRAVAERVVELGAVAWQIQLTVALGRAADRPDLLLQPWHLLELFPQLVAIKKEILEPGGVQLFPGNNIGYFGPFEAELRYGGDAGHTWMGCGAGRAALGLEADGKLKGCPSLPTVPYTGGNVRDTPIAELWAHAPEISALGRRTTDDLWGFCGTCRHAAVCKAGCTWTAHALFGRPGNNPYCHHRAWSLAQTGLRERVVLVEKAPGRPFDHGRYEIVVEPLDAETPDEERLAPVPRARAAALFGLRADAPSAWSGEDLVEATRSARR